MLASNKGRYLSGPIHHNVTRWAAPGEMMEQNVHCKLVNLLGQPDMNHHRTICFITQGKIIIPYEAAEENSTGPMSYL